MEELNCAACDLKSLVERIGGDIDAWLQDDISNALPHGPVSISGNQISSTYLVPPETRFYMCWSTRPNRPITALGAIVRPPPFSGSVSSCRATVHIMDKDIPGTQMQTSHTPGYGRVGDGWFVSPSAYMSGFLQLEIRKATKDLRQPSLGIYITDPQDISYPSIIFRFNLIGIVPVSHNPTLFVRSRSPSPGSVRPQEHNCSEQGQDNVQFIQLRNQPSDVNDTQIGNAEERVLDLLNAATTLANGLDVTFKRHCWQYALRGNAIIAPSSHTFQGIGKTVRTTVVAK
ncbi:hypothetical protein C8R43DRAFT_1051898 [Mycena crocata]|nr:hypothetical protein C8R43DRAFT_1051898 [Mycena crocata]